MKKFLIGISAIGVAVGILAAKSALYAGEPEPVDAVLEEDLRVNIRTDLRDEEFPEIVIEIVGDGESWRFLIDDSRHEDASGDAIMVWGTADGIAVLKEALDRGDRIRSGAPLPEGGIDAMALIESQNGLGLCILGTEKQAVYFTPVLVVGCSANVQGGTCGCSATGPNASCTSDAKKAVCSDGANTTTCSGSAQCTCVTTKS